MTTFANAVKNQEARTENNMKARAATGNACVDFFYKVGAMRGRTDEVLNAFVQAYHEDKELALRLALWVRDIRGGAGERQIFRDILTHLEAVDPDSAKALMNKAPLVGRWDDILVLDNALRDDAIRKYAEALKAGNNLAGKWAPRKGSKANSLRKSLDFTPKQYRKMVVNLSKGVVEQEMCSKQWGNINYSHVPSQAARIYRKAFLRNDKERYEEYVAELSKPVEERDPEVKINASAAYPHDIVKDIIGSGWNRRISNSTDVNVLEAQWDALPNYVGDNKVLAMVDVSGSMYSGFGTYFNKYNISPIHVALALGLYTADKNKGVFKDTFLTFSGNPELAHIKGSIVDKLNTIKDAHWGMNTNLHRAFDKILSTATEHSVPADEMPEMLLILSDMQFDQCIKFDHSAYEMIRHKYEEAGYKMPGIVFWNLNAYENAPVGADQNGVATVSGFSPAIMKNVLGANVEDMTPYGVMMSTIMDEKYNPYSEESVRD